MKFTHTKHQPPFVSEKTKKTRGFSQCFPALFRPGGGGHGQEVQAPAAGGEAGADQGARHERGHPAGAALRVPSLGRVEGWAAETEVDASGNCQGEKMIRNYSIV